MINRWKDNDKFVGRSDELKVFEKALANPLKAPRSLLIQGTGGLGKTWLIKRMLLAAGERSDVLALAPDNLLDMYSTNNRHLEGVMNALEKRFTAQSGDIDVFKPYREEREVLTTARAQEGYSEQEISRRVRALAAVFRSCMQRLTSKQIVVVAFDTFENVQESEEVADWILSDDGLQMPNLICVIGTRRPLTAMQKSAYKSVKEVGLTGLTDDDAVEFFKRYAGAVTVGPDQKAMIHLLNTKAGRNPLLLGLAIIWLDLPNHNLETIRDIPPQEFEQMIVSWVSPADPGTVTIGDVDYNEVMRQMLVLMAYLNRRFNRYFFDRLVEEEFIQLRGTSADETWHILESRKPDLFFVKERQEGGALKPDLFYVKERPEGEIQLHDKLAEMLRKYLLTAAFSDYTGARLQEFADGVVRWYDGLIAVSDNPDVLYAEQLAYLLRSDLYNDCQQPPRTEICGSKILNPDPPDLIRRLDSHRKRRSDVLARLIVHEIKLPQIRRFSDADQYEVFKLLGQLTSQGFINDAARIYWQQAADTARRMGDASKQVEALVGLHNSTQYADTRKSLEILRDAKAICEEYNVREMLPTILYEIGFTYRLLHDLVQANSWYDKALEQASLREDATQMPTILNDQGYIFLLMGDIQSARVSIRAARDFRSKKYQDLKRERLDATTEAERAALDDDIRNAAQYLGMSYSTLGDLARFSRRLEEAIERYDAAMSLFIEAKSRYWQTRMYFSRGEARRRHAAEHYNASRYERGAEIEKLAEADIQQSLKDCERYGYLPESITALRRYGRMHHDRMFRETDPEKKLVLLDQARDLFVEAYERAERLQDSLEILETLVEIAFLTDDYLSILKNGDPLRFEEAKSRGEWDIERLHEYIELAHKQEFRVYQFPVFQHLWEIERGAYFFELGEYDKALDMYTCGFVGMAGIPGYGVARYLQHLDHLVRQIRRLSRRDRNRAEQWRNALLEAWEKADLTEKRSELPQEIKMLKVTAFLHADVEE